ncbi:uncharacterized protein B0H18DRAFT_887456 [Fomitopsis serialis]|uniref:uncharacterized protein n=1 Tax=Fomitopsis serialis TaxID=139415 RepID=UPI0020079F5D|nr:uncharacterized protein B0H18DRAFT_887456 [Neoantrodia serialis]KAH9914110.1 hypothetical protein B0H18DRAFT_887456 [Neoantrodia serialis]
MPVPPADVFGVVYIIENAQQFWSELEDMLNVSDGLTLERLDATLRRFVSFCAAYHEQYLQSPLQMEHACDLLIASELFQFHSQRMTRILCDDTQKATDPHQQLILYGVLLAYGRRKASFLRDQKRWQPLLPLLMDNVLVDVDPDVEDTFSGTTSGGSGYQRAVAVPIEAKLRTQSVRILYEVCRVQKMTIQELDSFSDSFIDYLFDLIEQTRHMQDETFNYSVIKLLVALNEQFMVAALHSQEENGGGKQNHGDRHKTENDNRVLQVLMTRRGSSMTFGENMIFMLNRASRSPEDLCMQLLVLKLLYLLFRTEGMSEYFYTNDLCVLVDVFLREIGNIDEDNESLRHTYLRVLHPLLTKTQLRSMPYKRGQIVHTLESLIENESIRDIDPTTKRLVLRCLAGDWCVQFRKKTSDTPRRVDSPALSSTSAISVPQSINSPTTRPDRSNSFRGKNAKASRSAENLLDMGSMSRRPSDQRTPRGGYFEGLRQPSADSTMSLPRIVTASTSTAASSVPKPRHRAGSMDTEATTAAFSTLTTRERSDYNSPTSAPAAQASMVMEPASPLAIVEPPDSPVSVLSSSSSSTMNSKPHRRAAPPPPAKRRKPPAVPAGRAPAGHAFSAIGASSSQPSLTSLLPRRQ